MVSGGEDGGMEVSTTTISCVECQELYDVVSGRIVFADIPPAQVAWRILPMRKNPARHGQKTSATAHSGMGKTNVWCGGTTETKWSIAHATAGFRQGSHHQEAASPSSSLRGFAPPRENLFVSPPVALRNVQAQVRD